MISKVYFKKESNKNANRPKAYNEEKNNQEDLAYILTTDHVPSTPYSYKYKKQELYNKLNKNTQEIFKKRNHTNMNGDLYITRMPYLGTNVFQAVKNVRQIRSVPFTKIANEILKLLQVVQKFIKNSVIHGDIRDTNVLINLKEGDSFGDLTIIDFDLLSSFNAYSSFKLNSYHMPPECFMMWSDMWNNLTDINDINGAIEKGAIDELLFDIYMANPHLKFAIGKYNTPSYNNVVTNMKMLMKEYLTSDYYHTNTNDDNRFKSSRYIFETINISIDLYGLGYTIHLLLSEAWYENENNTELYKNIQGVTDESLDSFNIVRAFIFNELIPHIMNPIGDTRWSIFMAIKKYKEMLTKANIQQVTGGKWTRYKRTRRPKRNKTKRNKTKRNKPK